MLDVAQAEGRLVAVGERGFIIISDDDGHTWDQTESPVSDTLTRVQFVDADLGWAVGHGGVVLHTSDGGDTWRQQLDGEQAAQIELDAAVKAQDASPNELGQRRVALAERLVSEGADKPFLAVHFFDSKSGVILGAYGLAFATEDGGKTWDSIIDQLENPRGLHLYDFEIVGGTYFIAGEQGLLLRSDGQGRRFRMLDTPATGTLFGLLPASSRGVLAFGLKGRMFISEDKGDTWKSVSNDDDVTITDGERLSDGTLLLVDEAGRLLVSRDGGKHFDASPVPNPTYLTGLTRTKEGAVVLTSVRGVFRLPPDNQVVEN
jgi:photosystem II stability/assembly factor-like uncharacterized protein